MGVVGSGGGRFHTGGVIDAFALAHDDGPQRGRRAAGSCRVARMLEIPTRYDGRQEVDESHHVADGARDELDRLSLRADDAQAVRLLAGRPARGEHLEQHVVREHDQEVRRSRPIGDAEAAVDGHREYRDGDDEDDLDRQVDERGRDREPTPC